MSFRLERLRADHPVAPFSSGDRPGSIEIDAFLRERAWLEQQQGWSATTLAIDPAAGEERAIVGFYTLSPLVLRVDPGVLRLVAPERVYPHIGGYLLGRLGVARHWQSRGLGALLVERAIDAACIARQTSGGAFLAVDPKNASLCSWYERLGYGFARLAPERWRLVMRLPPG